LRWYSALFPPLLPCPEHIKSKEEYEEKVITHKNVRANKIIHPCDALENKEFEE
jgi:hypothetical protein